MTRTLLSAPDARILTRGVGRLRPRARIIRTIGAELISSELVAAIELVRNSWDADATRVDLVFRSPHLPDKASLEIRDDGHGMDREILLGPWLEPATPHKATARAGLGGNRSPSGRRRLGSKGVGRFAAQRLGHRLKLQTKIEGSSTRLGAEFDWESLDSDEHYLDQMEIHWKEFEASDSKRHGTSLFISRLRDHWTEDRFARLRLGLSRLLGPGLEEEDFQIYLIVDGSEEKIQPALDAKRPMYSLEGDVQTSGIGLLHYRDISGTRESWERSVLWPSRESASAGPFKFCIKVWDLDRDALERYFELTRTNMGLRDFRRVVREHSGVSLYRDGFRILPYGESDNDWLRLDRRRVNNPTLRVSNNQILGWVQLTADGNPQLRDQTNREGLVTNEAYQHLQKAILELLSYLEARRFRARRSLGVGQKPASMELPLAENQSDQEIERVLESLEEPGQSADGSSLDELRSLMHIRRKSFSEAIRQYAGLAATGQLSNLVFSQLRHPLGNLLSEIFNLEDTLEDLEIEDEVREDFESALGKMRNIIRDTQLRMDRMDPFATPSRGRKPERFRLAEATEAVCDAFLDKLSESDIDPEVIIEQDSEVVTDRAALQNALALIIENALYWLSSRKQGRRLRFRVQKEGLVIENNGPPINRSDRAEIFSPHFTTRRDAAGMGLTLARDLLSSIGISIQLARSTKHWTSFAIQVDSPG